MWKSLKQILVFSFTGSHWCYGGECHNIHRAIIHESMSRRFYEPMIHILQNMYNAFTLKIYDHVRISNLIHQQRFPDIYKIWPDWIKRNQHRKHCFMTWNQRTHGRHSLSDTVRLLHILLESQESVISRLVDYIPVPILPMSSCSGSADNIRTRPFETNPAHSLGMTWCAPSKQGTNSTSQEQTKFTNPTCPISHNTPPLTRNVHIFVPRYTVGYGTGALWDVWDWFIMHMCLLYLCCGLSMSSFRVISVALEVMTRKIHGYVIDIILLQPGNIWINQPYASMHDITTTKYPQRIRIHWHVKRKTTTTTTNTTYKTSCGHDFEIPYISNRTPFINMD